MLGVRYLCRYLRIINAFMACIEEANKWLTNALLYGGAVASVAGILYALLAPKKKLCLQEGKDTMSISVLLFAYLIVAKCYCDLKCVSM